MRCLPMVLALSLTLALATPASPASFLLGLRGGSSVPNLRDNSEGNDFSGGWATRVAPYGGVFAQWPREARWSLQVEASYAAQGGQRSGMQRLEDPQLDQQFGGMPLYARFKSIAKLDYIEIPVLARYALGGPAGLSVMAGPYAGFLVSAKTVTSGVSTVYTDKAGTQPVMISATDALVVDTGATTDNKADLHTFSWGMQLGVAAMRPMGPGQVTLDVRGGLGLANIQKDTATNGKNSTGNVTIALGYAMPFGER